ncbi:hypothetical protein Aca07nite_87020 [Actinoplanes capillaceus]|uniref:Sortase family protein n=1 Tax=Actinoplanes campanulatus TaxID=113559 RepID=A0ABQ3WYR0_9ACTN|nr:hypothetical protein Aca07nite_87020 [Actinoplanes capillaceus]
MSAVSASPAASGSVLDPVRALQHALYRAAKADPGRRFHALRDKVFRRDVLRRAWVAVRRNNGAPTGDFAIPPSVDQVGWYRYGPGFSADADSIVVAGHVDSAAEGEGAFFRLGTLDAGDEVTLTGKDGKTRHFEVVARKRYEKTTIALQDKFARNGALRLTLITCGGYDHRPTGDTSPPPFLPT